MTDTAIKGTRNSRSILGNASIPESWEEARAQLIASGWPIDLGPLNSAGLVQRGDDLNKANLLKDATAALYDKDSTAVPDDILAAIRSLIATAQSTADTANTIASGKSSVLAGAYSGTGSGGAVQKITTNFFPKAVLVVDRGYVFSFGSNLTQAALAVRYNNVTVGTSKVTIVSNGFEVAGYMNESYTKFHYLAIG